MSTHDPTRMPPAQSDFSNLISVDSVVGLLKRRIHALPAEAVPIHRAAGRILFADIAAPCPVPSFRRSAMDGYALRAAETQTAVNFKIAGEALPSRPFDGQLPPEHAVRIMTGAPVPDDADAVVPIENAEGLDPSTVRVGNAVDAGKHVIRIGEDIEAGSVVLQAGRCLRPQDLGVLASIGVGDVDVIRAPSAAVLVTGNELLPAGSKPEGYRIVDSNSIMLDALLTRDGASPIRTQMIADDRESIRTAIADACEDVLLITGGTSVGKEDHAPHMVAELGELAVHGVAMRPARPAGIGFLGQRPVFLLPGNPVACLCAYDLFASLAVRTLGGRGQMPAYRRATLPLASPIVSAAGRVDYVRVCIESGRAEPVAASGASILTSTTHSDGYILVPAEAAELAAGAAVDVYFYDSEASG